MKPAACVLVIGLISSAVSVASEPLCKGNTSIISTCFTVHGRLSNWNGNPSARIWPIGTKRILGVREGTMPEGLRGYMANFSTEIWGDFEVCPLTAEKPGHMRIVCIETWKNIKVLEV